MMGRSRPGQRSTVIRRASAWTLDRLKAGYDFFSALALAFADAASSAFTTAASAFDSFAFAAFGFTLAGFTLAGFTDASDDGAAGADAWAIATVGARTIGVEAIVVARPIAAIFFNMIRVSSEFWP